MEKSFKLSAFGVVYSTEAPENTNVWWMDTSILSASVSQRLKIYDDVAKKWVLYYSSNITTPSTPPDLSDYVPVSRTITINGVTYDLSTDRSWTISSGTVTSVSAGTGMSFSTITGAGAVAIDATKVPYYAAGFSVGLAKWNGSAWVFDNNTYLTTISGLNISLLNNDTGYITSAALSGYVPTSRTLTINGTAYDLSADRSWTISAGISSLNTLTAATQTFAVGTTGTDFSIVSGTSTHTFNLPTASGTNRGALSSADWTTFNGKIGGTLTAGRVPYASGTSTLTDSANLVWDNTNNMLRIGGQPAIASSDVANFVKNQNNPTGVRVINSTSGANGMAYFNATINNGSNGMTIAAYSAGYGTGTFDRASTGTLVSTMPNGMTIATTNASGTISFYTNNVERGRFLSTGEFLIGKTTISAAADVMNIYKNQNAYTAVRLINNTSGTAGSAGYSATANNYTSGIYMNIYSAGFTTNGVEEAGVATLWTNSTGGLNVGTNAAYQLSFWTNNTKRATIDSLGNKIFTNGALATTATDGFVYIPSCAGLPTGVPTAVTGGVPLVADSTNNKIYAYVGGAWTALN